MRDMGCHAGKSTKDLQEELKLSENDVSKKKAALKEREKELQQLKDARVHGEQGDASLENLRRELQARQQECQSEQDELQRKYAELQHRAEERELERAVAQSSRAAASSSAGRPRVRFEGHSEAPHPESQQQIQQRSERDYVRQLEATAARHHREEAEVAENQLHAIREQLKPLKMEQEEAARDLQEAREQIQAEQEGHESSVSSSLERRLAESRSEHSRAEQRSDDLERHLKEQMKDLRDELQSRQQELRQRDKNLQDRDKELAEVNGQLEDLRTLFEDVNQQLQTECGRIEQLQETVALCAKQGKELEALQSMLEESHRVLAHMRDALEHERRERGKAAEQLEHEQQRTQLLLDVLKHFKEKLQGLTPQMLLSRLGGSGDDLSKVLTNGVSTANGGASGMPLKGSRTPSPQGRDMRLRANVGNDGHEVTARAQNAFVASPRRPASEGVTSTIAPELSSVAMWPGGSAAALSAYSGGRTPSPAPSRGVPSPSLAPPLYGAPPSWPPLQSVPPVAGEPWGAGFSKPLAAPMQGRWDMGAEMAKTLPFTSMGAQAGSTNMAGVGAHGFAGGSFGRP